MSHKKIILSALFIFIFISVFAQSPVKLSSTANEVYLSNEFIKATIQKKTATIISLRYKGLEMMGKAHPHWNVVGVEDEAALKKFPERVIFSIRTDPKKNNGERAEVSFSYTYQGDKEAIPFDIDLRFSLGKADHGIYLSALWKHKESYPEFELGQGRMIAVVNPKIFDFYTVDAKRRQVMASAEDVKNGKRMNVKEANLLTTGIRKGEVEHKYDYSAILAQTPAWGWTSTENKVGAWMINPSFEYINGGPTQVGNTGHVETILLNHWHDSHYGGESLKFRKDEKWEKFAGPFFLYFNSGKSHDELWSDALKEAANQRKLWPFAWVNDSAFPSKHERGTVTGKIQVTDPLAPNTKFSNMWVGLAIPLDSNSLSEKKSPNWQYEGKNYQFWVKADANGAFKIDNIRAGNYDLYAFADGILGEFKKTGILISPGTAVNLGTLPYIPKRFGKQLWEIGIPDRSAAEFKHGDLYWKWGLYMLYPKEFPNDVNYTVGKSDWSKDWNYAQPGVIDESFNVVKGTTWRINFDLPEALTGTATLRIAICGSRKAEVIPVTLNNKAIGTIGPMPTMGVMHRDGIRGKQEEYVISFDAKNLKKGINTITLNFKPKTWAFGVLYDYLRLEVQ
ncbi:MAG: hypothetical protein H7Y07_05685 [Pyrinomonadaceae bacterium]|nr:hypothetical protein [Sphingobacteriaceae bacterium]